MVDDRVYRGGGYTKTPPLELGPAHVLVVCKDARWRRVDQTAIEMIENFGGCMLLGTAQFVPMKDG